MAKVGSDTSAYFVEKFDETGSSAFYPILGEDIKNMLRGFSYNNKKEIWENGTISYRLRKIG